MRTCFCVLLYFTACMLYYCNTVGCAWWDWGLIWWLTILLQCFDTVGWVTWPVKISSPNDLYCVEWDVKPYSTYLLTAASVIGQPPPAVRTTTPTLDVRLSGLLCCWFDGLELVARQSTRPGTFSALLSARSQNFLILILLAYTARYRRLSDYCAV